MRDIWLLLLNPSYMLKWEAFKNANAQVPPWDYSLAGLGAT